MKKTKSRLLIILTLILLFSFTAQAGSYAHFPDVPDEAPFADEVNTLAELGLLKGDEKGNFNPENTITRAEFATMMCRFFGVEDEALKIRKSSFNDVPSNHWACGYITKAVELGILNGYGNGKFGPADTLTYEQAVTVLIRSIDYEDEAQKAGGYPNGYIKVAENKNLLEKVQSEFSKPIIRSNVAILICNVLFYGGEISKE